MSVFYHKLWDMMKKKNVTNKELVEQLNMSSATLTKLRKNQFVSLDTLDRIREYLECDYGDIIASVSAMAGGEVNWSKEEAPIKANYVYRIALIWYMERAKLTVQDVASTTTLALNTVKDFLKGKDLSLRSILKFSGLGNDYNYKVTQLLEEHKVKNEVYCSRRCGKRKECFGLRSEYHQDTNEYIPYCYLGFDVKADENGEIIAAVGCPHPKNTKELGIAIEKYGAYMCGKVEHIPAKDEPMK